MDPEVREQIAIILTVVLVSSGIGFLTAYYQFQPQITDLWNKIYDLQGNLNSINPTRIHELTHMIGTDHNTSEAFQISGNSIKIRWTMFGSRSTSQIIIGIQYQNGITYTRIGSSGFYFSGTSEIVIEDPGIYYLNIISNDLIEYNISVCEYY